MTWTTPTEDQAEYDGWLRARVSEALNDPGPDVLHDEVEAHFAERKAASRKAGKE